MRGARLLGLTLPLILTLIPILTLTLALALALPQLGERRVCTLKPHSCRAQVTGTYTPAFNDILCVPIYTPTLSDTILVELVDKANGHARISCFVLSLQRLRADDLEPQACSPAPLPVGCIAARARAPIPALITPPPALPSPWPTLLEY